MYQTALKTTQLGHTGLEITRVGFGAWALGGGDWEHGWGPQDDEESITAIHHALEQGINWIDTAAACGFGHSEQIVGRALDGLSDRPYLFTKCSLLEGPDRRVVHSLRRDSILREAGDSLKRLGVDAIDLYQLHWPIPAEDIEEGWAALAELKEQGVVRHIGVSNFDVDQLRKIQQIAPVETLQPQYSLIERDVERELLPFADHDGIGVIAYSPMGSGMLTGAMTRERVAKLPDDDWRKHDARFNEPQLSQNLDLVERLKKVADRYDTTPGAVAVAWTLHNPALDGAIVGFRRPDQVDPILAAASLELTEGDLIESKEEHDEHARIHRPGSDGQPDRRTPTRRRQSGLRHQPDQGQGSVTDRPRTSVARHAARSGGRSRRDVQHVTDDHALDAIASGPDGILAGLAAGKVYIDMSTVSPAASRQLAEHVNALGAQMLDAPVSGSIPQAETGTLAIFVGGNRDTFATVEPLPGQLGQTVTHVGTNGQGLLVKLAVNISLAVQTLAFSEGLLLAERGGIDPRLAAKAISTSSIASPMLKARVPLLISPSGRGSM